MSTDAPRSAGASERATPESLRGRSLSALTVKDLENSLARYRDVAGFTVDQKYERDGKLLAVPLKDDIAKGIKERGGTLESEPADMPWGARIFRLKDPDGYRFTISSER